MRFFGEFEAGEGGVPVPVRSAKQRALLALQRGSGSARPADQRAVVMWIFTVASLRCSRSARSAVAPVSCLSASAAAPSERSWAEVLDRVAVIDGPAGLRLSRAATVRIRVGRTALTSLLAGTA